MLDGDNMYSIELIEVHKLTKHHGYQKDNLPYFSFMGRNYVQVSKDLMNPVVYPLCIDFKVN